MNTVDKLTPAKPTSTLVFLHYFGGEAKSWQWVTPHLEKDYPCICLNLPGFGGTPPLKETSITAMAQWVLRELALLDVYDCILIGHSMSGKIALQVASMPTELTVRQLILVAPSPPTTEPMPDSEKKRMLKHPDPNEAEQTVKNASQYQLDPKRKAFAIQSQLKIDQQTWQWWLTTGMDHSILKNVKQIKAPITVITSLEDPVITQELIENEVMAHLPHADLITCKGPGHLLPLEVPDWVAQKIKSKLEV